MGFNYLHLIPDDILYYYIWPNISNNIKMLLNKQLFNKYYQQYYDHYCNNTKHCNNSLNTKYLIYIIKNDIKISLSYLLSSNNIQMYIKNHCYYNDLIFFNYYNFFIYLSKKYKSYSCQKLLNIHLTQMNVKEYKKYVNKNIRWIK
mgnify:CR=1 FL=1|jgi:hypothetical protein